MQLAGHLLGSTTARLTPRRHEDQYNYNTNPSSWYLTSQSKYCTVSFQLAITSTGYNQGYNMMLWWYKSNRLESHLTAAREHHRMHLSTIKPESSHMETSSRWRWHRRRRKHTAGVPHCHTFHFCYLKQFSMQIWFQNISNAHL